MNPRVLSILLKLRGITQSDLAVMAGVSRQAVSLWFKQSTIHLKSQNLQNLANGLGLKIDDLMKPLPVLQNKQSALSLKTTLLWDSLYPELDDFLVALVKGMPRAMARLVQVYGLYASAKMVGPVIWKKFHHYKQNIHPVRRVQCEQIWKIHHNPELI